MGLISGSVSISREIKVKGYSSIVKNCNVSYIHIKTNVYIIYTVRIKKGAQSISASIKHYNKK